MNNFPTRQSAMKRLLPRVVAVMFTGLLVSCGAGGGGGNSPAPSVEVPPPAPPPPPPPTPVFPSSGRVEESNSAVTITGAWTQSDSSWGWSGGSAVQSGTAGATISLTFIGTSVRWIGSRGRGMGIASVKVDGGPARDVDLFARPTDEIHTSVVTLSDLSAGQHTLTIQV